MKIVIVGSGRMGQLVHDLVLEKGHLFTGYIDESTDINTVDFANIDVAIDFSLPGAMDQYLESFVQNGIQLITGTTGLSDIQQEQIKKASHTIAIVQASNFSLGITILSEALTKVASLVSNKTDIEIVEKHHNQKVDAPSGTAISMAKTIIDNNQYYSEESIQLGSKEQGKRDKNSINIHSLRGGNITGDHSVKFILENEIITIEHRALNRNIFAQGAVHCIEFVATAKAGLYSLQETLK